MLETGAARPSLVCAARVQAVTGIEASAWANTGADDRQTYSNEPCLDCGAPLRVVEESESRVVYRCDEGHAWADPADASDDQLSLLRCPALDEVGCRG